LRYGAEGHFALLRRNKVNASLFQRWQNADLIVLSAIYGKRANTVLSRPARKPVAYASGTRPRLAGIPIPVRRVA
jgi:hypothetical protein